MRETGMIWCRFHKGNTISRGIVESDTVTAVDGDPGTLTSRVAAQA